MSDPTQPPNDLQAYETAFHALLSAVHVIAVTDHFKTSHREALQNQPLFICS